MKVLIFISGIALTISMAFVWPMYYLIAMAYLVARFAIALARREETWTIGAILFVVLIGPFSGLIELIEWYEINEYIEWIRRK